MTKLKGLEPLWQISLDTMDKKARELSQDLLIRIYLKQDKVSKEQLTLFVDRCMQNITKEGVVDLLSQLFDRFEGIKEVKIDYDM